MGVPVISAALNVIETRYKRFDEVTHVYPSNVGVPVVAPVSPNAPATIVEPEPRLRRDLAVASSDKAVALSISTGSATGGGGGAGGGVGTLGRKTLMNLLLC